MKIELSNLDQFNNIKHAISTVSDGNMSFLYGNKKEVLENRKKFLEKNNLSLDNCLTMRLQHGDKIEVVDVSSSGRGMYELESAPEADCLITKEVGLGLFLIIADCLPVIIYDPENGTLALVHLGWRSTNTKLIQKTIRKMVNNFNSDPKNLMVFIGPGIHKESYKYKKAPQSKLPGWKNFTHKDPDGLTSVDLYGYNFQQALDMGVLKDNIFISNIDTFSSKELFSHRRSEVKSEPEGRFAVVVCLK